MNVNLAECVHTKGLEIIPAATTDLFKGAFVIVDSIGMYTIDKVLIIQISQEIEQIEDTSNILGVFESSIEEKDIVDKEIMVIGSLNGIVLVITIDPDNCDFGIIRIYKHECRNITETLRLEKFKISYKPIKLSFTS